MAYESLNVSTTSGGSKPMHTMSDSRIYAITFTHESGWGEREKEKTFSNTNHY